MAILQRPIRDTEVSLKATPPEAAGPQPHQHALMIARLEAAAAVLKAMPCHGIFPAERMVCWPEIVRSFYEAYGSDPGVVRPPRPSPAELSDADAVFALLLRLGEDHGGDAGHRRGRRASVPEI